MKSSIRSFIIKSTTVEITSPFQLELPQMESKFKKHGVPAEFQVFTLPVAEIEDSNSVSPLVNKESNDAEIITQAKIEAEYILAEARKQAAEILVQAQGESDNIRKSLEQTVRAEIIPLAKVEGFQQGIEEAQREANNMRLKANYYLELSKKILQEEYQKVDSELVKVCIRISEKIIRSSLSLDPTRLLSLIRNLTLLPMEKEAIRIHLSLEDSVWYRELNEEDKPIYPVIIDESLKPGDAFLECAEGIFDARLDSQLNKMTQYFLEELEHGGLDGISSED